MDLTAILYPIYCIGGLGLVFGVGLGLAAKKFAVPVDERVDEVKEHLPGANCGGCGFAGCEALAKSIVSGESPANACPVCNASQIEGIAKAMGVEAKSSEKKVAVLRCKGSNIHAKLKYDYAGLQSCADAQLVGGGPKVCTYGCLGYGDCKNACLFGAITVEDGLAIIHPDKCVACGACQKACPRSIIHIVPAYASYHVNCISRDKGKEVKAGCAVGCIGCGICAKQCEVKAITIENNLARIDATLCVQCGKCKEKCPTKAITNLLEK